MSKPPTREQVEFSRRLPQTQQHEWSKDSRYNQKRTLWAKCSACGDDKMIAYGFVAQAMERRELLRILIEIGWKVAPKFLCPHCRPKMTEEEMIEGKRLIDRIEEGGNDGADIEDFGAFHRAMSAKYGAGVLADPSVVAWYDTRKKSGGSQS